MAKQSILVWDLPVRIFHWLLAACFVGAFATGDSERWRDIHIMLGYTMLILIAFRVLWGFVGSRYARFGAFAFGPGRVAQYLQSLLGTKPEHHVGHNPAGALAIFALLGLGFTSAASGWAVYEDLGGHWLEEAHEILAAGMLAVVFLHLAGVFSASFLHDENLVRAMVTGQKNGAPADGIRRTRAALAVLLVLAVLGYWWLQWQSAPEPVIGPVSSGSAKYQAHDNDD